MIIPAGDTTITILVVTTPRSLIATAVRFTRTVIGPGAALVARLISPNIPVRHTHRITGAAARHAHMLVPTAVVPRASSDPVSSGKARRAAIGGIMNQAGVRPRMVLRIGVLLPAHALPVAQVEPRPVQIIPEVREVLPPARVVVVRREDRRRQAIKCRSHRHRVNRSRLVQAPVRPHRLHAFSPRHRADSRLRGNQVAARCEPCPPACQLHEFPGAHRPRPLVAARQDAAAVGDGLVGGEANRADTNSSLKQTEGPDSLRFSLCQGRSIILQKRYILCRFPGSFSLEGKIGSRLSRSSKI